MVYRWRFWISSTVVGLVMIGIILYICTFKLIDNDYWWHVKAGEIMWKTGALIAQEPFSYVLVGKPYGALHEWLAQIIFYLHFTAFGVTGAILLRGIIMCLAALLILLIGSTSIFLTAPIIVAAIYAHRASLMVRPQLFTILFLCLFLWIIFRSLQRQENRAISGAEWWMVFSLALFMQILWVNIHGASAIFGVIIAGAYCLQGWYAWYGSTGEQRNSRYQESRARSLFLGAMALALLASPNGVQTFVDMYMHRFDRTIPLVREWMPLVWHDYVTDVLPFGFIAAVLTLAGRRSWVLCMSLLIVMGLLSLQAYRHCILLVLASLSIISFQFDALLRTKHITQNLKRFSLIFGGASAVLMIVLFFFMYSRDRTTLFRNNDFGFGIRIPVEGAVRFVQRENIRGTLFNTYNQGGYLLHAFAPDRKVFADGRNIEYGYPFIQKLLDASTSDSRWRELDARYHFSYAIVEYTAMPEYGMMRPYLAHFEADPSWKLVYLDDAATVYVRSAPEYSSIIKKYAYDILTPSALEFSNVLDALSAKQWVTAEKELLRVIADQPTNIKALLVLGNRYLAARRIDDARRVALEAQASHPYFSEVYELLGRISVETQDWSEAGHYFEQSASLASAGAPRINYDYLAMIFSKSGEYDKAGKYHRKALRAGQNSRPIDVQSSE